MTLGERIRTRRKELGYTLTAFAIKANISKAFLSDVERNKRRIGADKLLSISQVLGVPLDYLMGQPGSAEPPTSGVASLPGSLIRLATDLNLPFKQAMCLYWCHRTLMDHRSPPKRVDAEKWDWTKFYEAIKEWLE